MKVQRDREGVGFRTFDVTLTIESEKEARALYAIFNYVPNTSLLPRGVAQDVRDVIGPDIAILGDNGEIANGVTYADFYLK